ncbi:heavy metal-transporting ATPase [Cypionkella aquatica]|uniref:P-type Zn(2+) transporter n=1 Tax=Cypionkella aquatica TaxID=1756042 RepID=A0AA37TQA9_9RHOB|nr:heavy metal translocating P-type ATPase [Cypionkella aquatica]GLS85597.1 heavy metal-transporting ATPase [Cypionkella aquatica]
MTQPNTRHDWTISGMDCASCAAKITKALERLPGVSQVQVGVMSEKLSLHLQPDGTGPEAIEAAVKKLGYGIAVQGQAPAQRKVVLPGGDMGQDHAGHDHGGGDHDHAGHDHGGDDDGGHDHGAAGHSHTHGSDPADRGKSWYQTAKGSLVISTGLLLAAAWGVRAFASEQIAAWAFIAACLIGVAPVAMRAFAALRAGIPFTIEALMTIAAIGALFIGAAEEAAMVVFLFAIGEVLEGVAADRARASIRALADLVPKTALLDEAGVTREVDAAQLQIGQRVLVRPGDRIPADGVIAEGSSGIDESPVTGESMPKTKGPGDAVFAGSINAEAALRITVSKAAEDNTIARIIALVEEAEAARAPTERFIDRFSRIYMPLITLLAALVAVVPPLVFGQVWEVWIYRGLSLLLIGCPCALVISVPASIASALSTGARRGILMKGGSVIEAVAGVSRVAFDKTGTLTAGSPAVTDLVVLGGDEAALLSVAAGVEHGSGHPLALAIMARAAAAGIATPEARDAKALIGQGAEAVVDGARAWIASPRFAAAQGVLDDAAMARANALEAEGKTVVVVFREGVAQGLIALGLIALRDEPRRDAIAAVAELQALGVSAVMLTGDNARTGAAIAAVLGMEHRAELMPDDKVREIKAMASAGGVMMVGDGINDAPALAAASVGVAMGSGSDVALETASAALLRNRVTDAAAMIRLARAAMGNIRQNVAIALGLKAVFLITTVLGLTGLWLAIMADTGATVLVTLNALRLLRFNPEAR